VASPSLLVFASQVEANIARMREHLERVAPGSGFAHLRSHAKTHKASWTTRLQLERGIEKFKATPNELAMLLASGVRDVFLAYPLLDGAAQRVAAALAEAPDLRVLTQVARPEHGAILARAAARYGVEMEYLIDLDVGMHRTGAGAAGVRELRRAVGALPGGERLRCVGLHAYDGHNKGPTPEARREIARQAMGQLLAAVHAFGDPVPLVVAGGSPGFLPDLEVLLEILPHGTRVEVSPGTWIYWDSNYERLLPGLFHFAALILAHVMDRPGQDLVTLDLGHKRWAIDSGPVVDFSIPGLEVVSASEEHTVLRCASGAARPAIGAPVLIAPRHVCSTVNLWGSFALVGADGEVVDPAVSVDARNP
jgi:D-serine deaminase-like pyridoxal phosphate-dependent protein